MRLENEVCFGQTLGLDVERYRARLAFGAKHDLGPALERFSRGRLITLKAGHIGTGRAGKSGGAIDREHKLRIGVRLPAALAVGDFNGDEQHILTVGRERRVVRGQAEGRGGVYGFQRLLPDFLPVCQRDGPQLAGPIDKIEDRSELLLASGLLFANQAIILEELNRLARE